MSKIVILPPSWHRNYLEKCRQNDAFIDVKTYSKIDLEKAFFGECKEEAILYLILTHKFNYETAKLYLSIIPYINNKDDRKLEMLFSIKNELLEKGYLYYDEAFLAFIKSKEVDVLGYYPEDEELNYIFHELGISANYQNLDKKEKEEKYVVYKTIDDEVLFALNQVASLLAIGVNYKDILIYAPSDEYDFYLNKYAPGFGFRINTDSKISFYNNGLSAVFLKAYRESNSFADALESLRKTAQDDDNLIPFINLIKVSYHPELDKDSQTDYFIGKLKETYFKGHKFAPAIDVMRSPNYVSNKKIIVLGFKQGSFPEVNKDNDYLTDKEKESLHINTSLISSALKRKELIDFLDSNNDFYYSVSIFSTSGMNYLSPFIMERKMQLDEYHLPNTIYSLEMIDYLLAKSLDKKNKYSENSIEYESLSKLNDIPYETYDHKYHEVNHFNNESDIDYSYTDINSFYECPFKYYLNKIINLDEFETSFSLNFGKVAHAVFERQYHPDFNFEKVYQEESNKYQWNAKEKVFLQILKEEVKKASDAALKMLRYSAPYKLYLEKHIRIPLTKHAYLKGVIDKAVVLNDEYLYLVDYKTGSDKFETKYLDYGLSLQLPTYALLASQDYQLTDHRLVGLYLNNVINSSSKKEPLKEDQLIAKSYRLNGKTINDLDIISKIDSTIADGESRFIATVKTKSNGVELSGVNYYADSEFDNITKLALTKYLNADKSIRSNHFPIAPIYISSNLNGCKYCPYKDICFHKYSDRVVIENDDNEEEEYA